METRYFYLLLSVLLLPLLFPAPIDAQVCDPACEHNGICKPGNACQCANNGWTGSRCEVPICSGSGFPLGCRTGVCVSPNMCNCTGTGFGGVDCSIPQCSASPCQNKGKCVGPNTCDCTGTGYTGATCNVPICNAPKGCGPGTCVAPEVCNCVAGWSGKYCDTPICSPSCENGGICYGPNACDCTHTNFTDDLCQTPVCDPPCENGGECIEPDVCNCTGADGWNGERCQLGICAQECLHGGYCSAPDQCNCDGTGYAGAVCEVDLDECSLTDPVCDPQTTCSNSVGSYSCSACPEGFLGDGKIEHGGCFQCTTGCTNGVCIRKDTCNCTAGWSGPSCDQDVDECATSPCDSLTTCVNTPGSWHCTPCPDGYSGSGETSCVLGTNGSTTAFLPTATTGTIDQHASNAQLIIVGHLLVAVVTMLIVFWL